jgi:tRNA-2-methylthio-N6-dimethylallyladenosine synthase
VGGRPVAWPPAPRYGPRVVAGTVYIETYGCQMNLADSELIAGAVAANGWVTTSDPTAADAILVNTCAIREHAEERVVGRLTDLARLKRARPDVILGMCGCMAQHHRAAVAARVPALDLIVGPDAYRRLPALLDASRAGKHGRGAGDPLVDVRLDPDETYDGIASSRRDGAVRAWVTVMRGCDKFCTFCVVPYVRGRERSVPAEAVLAEVRDAAEHGVREVVFLGQTVNAYRDGDTDFADLLRRTAEIDRVARIRFTSPHPSDMTPALVRALGEVPKLAPQLHLPVQSGSDAVLDRMARGYTTGEYRALVARLREAVPELALSTDVIVGFPGETERDFAATRALIAEIGYDQAFLFKYSPRSMTKAARWDDTVADADKQRRLAELIDLQEAISAERNRRWIGRRVEVLVEGPARRPAGHVAGKTPHFVTTVFESSAPPGSLVEVQVVSASAHTLIGIAEPAARPAA